MSQAPTDEEHPAPAPAGIPSLVVLAVLGTVITPMVYVTLGAFSQMANIAFGMWFAELFIFFGVPFLMLRLAGYDALRTTGTSRPWVAGAVFGFLVGAVNFFAFVVPLQFVSQTLAPTEWVEFFNQSGIFKRQTSFELFAVVAGVCLAAPFCEEFFFRGLMQQGLQKAMNPIRAVVVTGFIFSFFHFDPVGFAARWELGIVFGLLMLRSGSIWPGVFAHLANNAISVALYFASGGAESDEDLHWWVPVAMLAAGIPLMIGLVRLAKLWPATLTPPWPATETLRPARPFALLAAWVAAAALAFGALFAVDFNGVRLNLIDSFNPLKEPKKTESAEAKQAWEALHVLRGEVRRGDAKLEEYELARKAAIADRESTRPKPLDFQF